METINTGNINKSRTDCGIMNIFSNIPCVVVLFSFSEP